jgi:hypothetical protein
MLHPLELTPLIAYTFQASAPKSPQEVYLMSLPKTWMLLAFACICVPSASFALPFCMPVGTSATFALSESTPDCLLGRTDVFFGNVAICEVMANGTGTVNNAGTDCTNMGNRSDVIRFAPVFGGGGLPTDTEVIICSRPDDGDQVDNRRPGTCNGAGGIFTAATTLAFGEARGETGNPVTSFTSPEKMPGGGFSSGRSYQLSDTPEPPYWALVALAMIAMVDFHRRKLLH